MDSSFKSELIAKALEIGFVDIGFAKFELLSEEIQNYKIWLESQYNANMKWMENNLDKRENISLVLNNCKTIIVTAYNYFTNTSYPPNNELINNSGKISRYALGDDYHDIVKEKLEQLEIYIKSKYPNSNTKSYCDTGPILEKIWAEKAGIGWQGKNSLIINKKYGSYFFLGIILTDLIIESNEVIKDYCGSCTKCISACPTDAIIGNKIVDSRKCIAYNTIELKSQFEIPTEIAENINNFIYGCDICQEVCPWNKNLKLLTNEKKFYPNENIATIKIVPIKNSDTTEFNLTYKNSPIKRTKLEGIKRNIRALEIFWNNDKN